MRQAAIAWQVYLLTHSPVALGVMGVVRVIPIVILSIFGGVLADVVYRRTLLIVTQITFVAVSLALGLTTLTGTINLPLIYILSAIGAATVAFDNPARGALIPSLVPPERLTNAFSLNSTAFEVAFVAGPGVAGVIIAAGGVADVYFIDAASYLAVLIVLFVIHIPRVEAAIQTVSLRAAAEGLRFVFRTPILSSTMGLDFVATFFGSATTLLPIFAGSVLHVGATGYGILYAAPSVGAIGAGVYMAWRGRRIHRQGVVIVVSVLIYAGFTVLFGLSHLFLLSLVALAGVGASDSISMILRQTIRQLSTPDAMRGRMTSVSMIFYMGGPQLGELEAGLVAREIGAPWSVAAGGLAALLAATLIALKAPRLLRHRRDDLESG